MARPTRRRLVVGVVLAAVASLATVAVVSTAGPAAAAPPPTSSFEKVRLDGGLSMGEPIELSVLPDGKVLYINRGTSSGGGQVRLYNPATGLTTVAPTLQLDARFEDGLIGITLHPQFATNRWVFLFYSPAQATLVNRVSRFTFNASTNVLDPASEDMIIEWPTERRLCCHSAGSMHGAGVEWPALDNPGGCGSPNHAEVYHYNPNLVSDVKWPQYYDNKLLITEYCRSWVKEVQFSNGNPATGNPTIIEPTLAGMQFVHPLDMEFGPDGSLYMLEYGNGGVDDVSVTGSGRWVRIYGTQRATQWGYSLWEFDVYGT